MNSLIDDAKKHPISNALIVYFTFLVMISFPTKLVIGLIYEGFNNVYFSVYFIRAIFSVIFVILFYKFGFFDYFKIDSNKTGWLTFIATLCIALNNFPLISILFKNAHVLSTNFQWQYLLAMFSVAFTEEIVFRGFILAFLAKYFLDKFTKNRTFIVILANSSIFALTHLFNIFNGASLVSTLLQVGYSFLIGVALALLALKSKSIVLTIVAHFIYNVGGNLGQFGLLYGTQWTAGQILVTVVVSVAVAVYVVYEIFRLKDEDLIEFLPEIYKN